MADVANSKLLEIDTGILKVQDACIVLVKTEWNAAIVDELAKGAVAELQKHSVKKIITITVPGAVEIPFAIRSFWDNTEKKKKAGCIYCIGLCGARRYATFRLCV